MAALHIPRRPARRRRPGGRSASGAVSRLIGPTFALSDRTSGQTPADTHGRVLASSRRFRHDDPLRSACHGSGDRARLSDARSEAASARRRARRRLVSLSSAVLTAGVLTGVGWGVGHRSLRRAN